MAQLVKSWLTLDKNGGSGDSTVTASATENNTGRNARTINVTFTAANCPDVVRTVTQAGKPEFVEFDNAIASVAKAGGDVIITGRSNSSKLTFDLGNGGDLDITLPASYTAAGVSVNNGTTIPGDPDPGATSDFAFSITISNISENTTVAALTKQLIVSPNSGTPATCNISQAAGDPTLSVGNPSGTLPWNAGTGSNTVTIEVTSNTTWSIS